jgi:choline dehydrogenase-like flavoprotein
VNVHTSELSELDNRVELHPSLTDDFGTPAPKLVYRRSENTQKILGFAIERSKELLETAGATRIIQAEWETRTSGRGAAPGHYLGTARMGTDPQRSVVDKWCRAHDVRNLFIIDGSVFTTSGATEPTSTIQANALRVADYLTHNARNLS